MNGRVLFAASCICTLIASTLAGSQRVAEAVGLRSRPPLVVALGDSITFGFGLTRPAQQNYAARYARRSHARLANLAVPGYTCVDVLQREVPKMPAGATVVILNCGINDIGGFGLQPSGLPDGHLRSAPASRAELHASETAFVRMLAAIRRRDAGARIVVFTQRHWQRMTRREDARFAADVDAWNAFIRVPGVRVVDIAADRRFALPVAMQSDLIHPNLAGHTALLDDLERATDGTPALPGGA